MKAPFSEILRDLNEATGIVRSACAVIRELQGENDQLRKDLKRVRQGDPPRGGETHKRVIRRFSVRVRHLKKRPFDEAAVRNAYHAYVEIKEVCIYKDESTGREYALVILNSADAVDKIKGENIRIASASGFALCDGVH